MLSVSFIHANQLNGIDDQGVGLLYHVYVFWDCARGESRSLFVYEKTNN